METAIGPCVEVAKCAGGPIARRINYLRKLSRNMNILKAKRDVLVAKEFDTNTKIRSAQEQGKMPLEEVLLWLKNVEEVKSQVSDIERSFEEHKTCCCFSNYYSRMKLAKLVVDVIQDVEELRTRQFPDELVIDQPKARAILLYPPLLFGDSKVDRIMELLMNPQIGKIGVYGMGGIGKTTIMKAINDKLATMDKFDRIIWVTVSKDNMGGIEGLQDKIAQKFGDNFRKQLSSLGDKVIRAAMLTKKLTEAGNFVLILDDLWQEIRLEDVGIPEPNEEKNKCKIVVTTRLLPVCNYIETQVNVEVKCLSEEAAWELFVSKTGDQVRMPDIEPLARQVMLECAGLPLAISVVGCAMRRKHSINAWSNTLNELRNSRGDDLGMNDKVFKFLRFSYDNLREEVKSCFLYCAFYSEDYMINPLDLIEHWMAEGYTIKGSSTSEYDVWDMEAEINKGFYILEELKDACMLETVGRHVRMHDLVRDLAIQIMRKDLNFLSKAGLELREWPEEAFKKACKISLFESEIDTFPDQPNCPNLSTLLLGMYNLAERERPMTIPRLFFSQMPGLQVLDLSELQVIELPESLSDLVDLRALFLEFIEVKKIPSLAKLQKLRMLSFEGSRIEETPAGMNALVNLRFLDLTKTSGLKNFHSDTISKLTLLEKLRMKKCDLLAKSSGIVATYIQEIAFLKRLTNLSMNFDDFDNYIMAVKCIQWNKLKDFNLRIYGSDDAKIPFFASGNHKKGRKKGRKIVQIRSLDVCSRLSSFCLPNNTEELRFRRCMVPQLSRLLCVKNLRSLKRLHLIGNRFREASAVEDSIVFSGDQIEPKTMESLENLTLENCHGLEVLCGGSLSNGCLANLKHLIVWSCPLKTLLSFKVLQHLKNIRIIKVAGCSDMEEIMEECPSDDSVTTTEILLPKLHTLILHGLSKLRCLSSKAAWICDSLKVVAVFSCPRLEQLPFKTLPASGIICGTSEWWEGLQWENPTRKALLQSHFKVVDEKHTEIDVLLQPHPEVTLW